MNRFKKLVECCREIVPCDTARILNPCGTMFLVVGFNRNTKEDTGQWVDENNEHIDFDYIFEMIVASGHTEEQLLASATEYKRICELSAEEYLLERVNA